MDNLLTPVKKELGETTEVLTTSSVPVDKVVHSPAYRIGMEGLQYTNLPVSPTPPVREVVDVPNHDVSVSDLPHHDDLEETEIVNLFMTQSTNTVMIASGY